MKKLDPRLSRYYKRNAVVLKIVRFALLLSFVIFSVYCIGYFRDTMTTDTMRYLLKHFNVFTTDTTPSAAEISISYDDTSSFFMLYNDLAVVSNTGCELYSFSGNKLFSYDHSYSNAAFTANGSNFLVYDTKGKELAVYTPVSNILKKTLEYDVKSAYINSLGYFSVVNSEKTYRSGVIVFSPEGNEMFRWMSPDKYVLSTALNANASLLACASVYNKSGAFSSELIVYDVTTGEKKHSVTLNDAMAMKIGYAKNDSRIFVLTDSKYICYDKDMNLIGAAEYNKNNAKFFKEYDDCFIIAQNNNLSGSSMTLYAYDYDGKLLFEYNTDTRITDISYRDNTLYVLSQDKLSVYDFGTNSENEKVLTKLAEQKFDKQYRTILTDEYGRYILISAKGAKRGSLAVLLEQQLDTGINE